MTWDPLSKPIVDALDAAATELETVQRAAMYEALEAIQVAQIRAHQQLSRDIEQAVQVAHNRVRSAQDKLRQRMMVMAMGGEDESP